MSRLKSLPFLVFSDKKGNILHHPSLRMAVSGLGKPNLPKDTELIVFPKKSSLFYLPQRAPIGFNPKTEKFEVLQEFKGKEIFAVAATPIPGYLRLHNPASLARKRKYLPFWAYTACGYYGGNFYIAAKRVDKRIRQNPNFYDDQAVKEAVARFNKKYPDNRLYQHLSNCALNYNCLAAKNLFLRRWEAPIPTSRYCNAKCIGCISLKIGECIPPHARINFKPKVKELVEVMSNHLKVAREAIVSFGQGCEGEPLLEADRIAESIVKVRESTSRGTINMNTNASVPKKIELLCKAGIDSFRVSLNSPQEKFYNRYFRPVNYKFKDVLRSIATAKAYNKFVSINLFILPGFSDSVEQINSLVKFVKKNRIDMIQWRNLNIDQTYYLKYMPHKSLKAEGIPKLLNVVKQEFPHLKSGYFNLPKEQFDHSFKDGINR